MAWSVAHRGCEYLKAPPDYTPAGQRQAELLALEVRGELDELALRLAGTCLARKNPGDLQRRDYLEDLLYRLEARHGQIKAALANMQAAGAELARLARPVNPFEFR